ncbi:hypothetical protein EJB05_49335, partial [Eragrostis curvula]
MRVGGMMCRSHAATAVCVPGEARSMVVARRADRTIVADDARALHDVKYARLGGDQQQRRSTSSSRRFTAAPPPPPPPPTSKPKRRGRAPVAVTLPMVTKSPVREASAKDRAAAAKRAPTVTAATATAPGDQLVQTGRSEILKRALCLVDHAFVMRLKSYQLWCLNFTTYVYTGGGDEGSDPLPGLCRESEEAYLQNGRVTSFSIDLESKKVTVMGHVSPAGVLESISKVKKAELLVV